MCVKDLQISGHPWHFDFWPQQALISSAVKSCALSCIEGLCFFIFDGPNGKIKAAGNKTTSLNISNAYLDIPILAEESASIPKLERQKWRLVDLLDGTKEFVKRNADKSYIIYENAILFESKSNLFCDLIITVYASLETKLERVILRDSTTEKEVFNRMKNQWKDAKKILQSNYIICNENLDETRNQVNIIHKILTKKK